MFVDLLNCLATLPILSQIRCLDMILITKEYSIIQRFYCNKCIKSENDTFYFERYGIVILFVDSFVVLGKDSLISKLYSA